VALVGPVTVGLAGAAGATLKATGLLQALVPALLDAWTSTW
jgi:hypothetical protein